MDPKQSKCPLVVRGAIALVAVALVFTGCDKGTDAPGNETVEAKGNQASGVVRYENGKPLSGAVVTAISKEFSSESDTKSGKDGKFLIKLPKTESNYRLVAWAEASYNGKHWLFPLEPVGGSETSFFSKDGIAKDFVWKISGRGSWASNLEEKDPNGYLGAFIQVYLYDPNSDPSGERPVQAQAGDTVELTLDPDGPLIDGRSGQRLIKAVVLERATGKFQVTQVGTALDIPVGRYKLTAKVKHKNGGESNLKVGVVCGQSGCPIRPSSLDSETLVEFQPNVGSHPRPYQGQPTAAMLLYAKEG